MAQQPEPNAQNRKRLLAPAVPPQSSRSNSEPATNNKRYEPSTPGNATSPKNKGPIDVLFGWSSPERVWRPKTNIWYLVSAAVIMTLILMAVKMEYYIVVIALLAFLLLWFVQGTMVPWTAQHKITNKGILTFGSFYRWSDIHDFWFSEKEDWVILQIDFDREIKLPRLSLLVRKEDQKRVFSLLVNKLKYGTVDEVGYNIIAKYLYGRYVPITFFIPDLDQPETSEPD